MEVLDWPTIWVPAEMKSVMREEHLEEENLVEKWRLIDYVVFEMLDRRNSGFLTICLRKTHEQIQKELRLHLQNVILQAVLAILLDLEAPNVFIRLERDRSCFAIVLLSNKGAHAYYGNGNFLARHRRGDRLPLVIHEEIEVLVEENRIVIQKKATKCCNTSLHADQNATCVAASKQNEIDEFADTSNLSFDILQRKPSDQELWTIGFNIGWEYPQLASMLGLSETELYHIKYDNRDNCVQRNKAMLFKWRENRENDGTFEELRNACIRAKINPGKILKGI